MAKTKIAIVQSVLAKIGLGQDLVLERSNAMTRPAASGNLGGADLSVRLPPRHAKKPLACRGPRTRGLMKAAARFTAVRDDTPAGCLSGASGSWQRCATCDAIV